MNSKKTLNVKQAYKIWSENYDTKDNQTRDLEAIAIRTILKDISFNNCLEIGCGTGKNTVWLKTKAVHIKAVDLSDEMLAIARMKIDDEKVVFQQADILQPWLFVDRKYDLISFSLVLEHIEKLETIFNEMDKHLYTGSYIYIGELHPFKQYIGTKAKFETENGEQIVSCFNHHISDFTNLTHQFNLEIKNIKEFFDDDDREGIPRILTLLLAKTKK
jgi:ubiquinone/menaquinone biosynthesis C-methylase UbiE